jgi:predicted nucleic acid-binding protein
LGVGRFYCWLAHFTVFFDKICSIKFRVTEGCLAKLLTAMRIYLDLCCYNRPFDEQTQIVIRLETEAKLFIQQEIQNGQIELVWSSMLDYENADNPSPEVRNRIATWKTLAAVVCKMSSTVRQRAAALVQLGIKHNDAVHIACAIEGGAEYFITTDKRILNKPVKEIVMLNLIHFLEEYNDGIAE